jgi:hyperosmotically inducible protein
MTGAVINTEAKMKKMIFFTVLLLAFGSSFLIAQAPALQAPLPSVRLESTIRSAVLRAPHYGVFDAVFFKLEGDQVTLLGQVKMPITKLEAYKRVSKLPGVAKVVNDIEVLPLSRFDDAIRRRAYRSVFSTAGLYRYALGAYPAIHIIVKHGHVTLEGAVATELDRKFALMAVRRIGGIFSVTNHLTIEK